MSESKETQTNNDLIKQRIRERYKGLSEDALDVIPANPHEDFYKSDTKKRVAVYARVSTDDPNQTSSYELQKNHYEDMVNRRPNWTLVDIYADEGISGTSLRHRDNFLRMISDCQSGKIDLIVTKSVSRFARNIIDCIGYVRQLKAAEPPIGVFFETENIFTLDENSEMSLSFIATLAQEESHTKSEIMNSSIEMRFKRGIFLTPVLLGYDHDEEGNLVINEEEAITVRLIFFSYLYGYSTQQIADALTELERITKKGNSFWSAGSVLQILENERYCGDVLARKTFTPNYLNHKSKKNKHDRNQYRQKDHHEPIISREDFFAVQKLLRNAKYGNKGYFPEMNVIENGFLKGFVTVHPKWAGFTEDDFYYASSSVSTDIVTQIPSHPLEIRLCKGSIDLRGYEVVRSEFFSSVRLPTISISPSTLLFNKVCMEKMPHTKKIEILIKPDERKVAVRQAPPASHFAMDWCKRRDDVIIPKTISGNAFLPTIYRVLDLKEGMQYKVSGSVHKNDNETIIIFDISDAILLVSEEDMNVSSEESADIAEEAVTQKKRKKVKAYPSKWMNSFGEQYYESLLLSEHADAIIEKSFLGETGAVYSNDPEKDSVTTPQQAAAQINNIIKDIGGSNG